MTEQFTQQEAAIRLGGGPKAVERPHTRRKDAELPRPSAAIRAICEGTRKTPAIGPGDPRRALKSRSVVTR
jgi:hypothetical protein